MRLTKRLVLAALLALLPLAAHAQTPAPTQPAQTQPATQPTRPVPEISRVLIISIDGLRPDLARPQQARWPARRSGRRITPGQGSDDRGRRG